MKRGERVAEAARGAVGARFRLHGRSVGEGLDCVGLAALALRAGGYSGEVPTGYPLRSGNAVRLAEVIADLGLRRVRKPRVGDLIAMVSGPGQLHLGIETDIGFVHADAGLRRVVERPGEPPWPVVGRWRLIMNGRGGTTWRR